MSHTPTTADDSLADDSMAEGATSEDSAARAGRRQLTTPAGNIAYLDQGSGPAALFIHGVFAQAGLWQGTIDHLGGIRRCLAPDLPAHGWTEETADADLSVTGLARTMVELLDGLAIDQVDLVGNDTGGAVAQILAARNPERIRSITLTNCDTHDGWPPAAFEPMRNSFLAPGGAELIRSIASDAETARASLAIGLERPELLDDDTILQFLAPLARSPERPAAVIRMLRAMDCADTVAVEPLLRQLPAPAQIIWGLADQFFDVSWARWLRDTMPNVERLVEIPGGKLFLPIDRPAELAAELAHFWARMDSAS